MGLIGAVPPSHRSCAERAIEASGAFVPIAEVLTSRVSSSHLSARGIPMRGVKETPWIVIGLSEAAGHANRVLEGLRPIYDGSGSAYLWRRSAVVLSPGLDDSFAPGTGRSGQATARGTASITVSHPGTQNMGMWAAWAASNSRCIPGVTRLDEPAWSQGTRAVTRMLGSPREERSQPLAPSRREYIA